VNTSAPRISGHVIQGKQLTASHGRWTHSPSRFTYRWQRCSKTGACSMIAHQTTGRYKLGKADVGHRIRVIVTAHTSLRSKPAHSKLTAIVVKPSSGVTSTSSPPGSGSSGCDSSGPSLPDSSTSATAYQIDPEHTGNSPDSFSASASRIWSDDLGASVSYPLIVDGKVYVIAADNSSPDPNLFALDASTGCIDWGPVPLGGGYPWADLTYDSGQVFIVNSDGTLEAFDAGTGALNWTDQLPGQYMFSSPPTAAAGTVYIAGAGSGGTVYAVTESDGALKWTAPVENGDNSAPAVTSTGVYASYACGQTYEFDPSTGSLKWWRSTECEGGGGKTPVVANGRVYVRDFSFPAVLDANSGSILSSFRGSGPAPAVTSSMIFNVESGVLSGASVAPGSSTSWTFRGDGTLSSAPIVAGDSVIVAGTSGEVYDLDSSTGSVLWSANAGAPVSAPDEQNVSQPLTGLAASGGLLVVPAGDTLVAYR
jgi:outer membrane protein assembly factor BamB